MHERQGTLHLCLGTWELATYAWAEIDSLYHFPRRLDVDHMCLGVKWQDAHKLDFEILSQTQH